MRRPLALVTAVAATAVLAVSAPGGANADLTVPNVTPTPLPTVSVPLPVETTVPLPETSLTQPVDSATQEAGQLAGSLDSSTGGAGTGSGGSGGSGSGSGEAAGTSSSSSGIGGTSVGSAGEDGALSTLTRKARERLRRAATPVIAGTPAARDLLDDENSPELLAASRDFLAADQGIAEIARQKRLMAEIKARAERVAADYRAYRYEIATAQAWSDSMHERVEALRRQVSDSARRSYVSGQPTADDGTVSGVAAALSRFSDGGTRADMRVGDLTVRREAVRADFEALAQRYAQARQRLEDANRRLTVLAAARADALDAVRAAQGSDVALQQARIAESGQLGAQIRAASAALERAGDTVTGSGTFAMPLDGHVTSPFGMRMHPILRYTKLHTGLDLAGGSTITAVDHGRVLMTVTSTAYGLFTVVDHGVIDGHRVTTAYAHQAQFLVQPGDAVRKGDPIGVVGSTGYSTGPHLHLEVREDGAVVDPMTWLAR